jgi:hypothetical protein
VELLATSGDVLRVWALEEGGQGDYGGARVGGGSATGSGYRLRERSKLSNVSTVCKASILLATV